MERSAADHRLCPEPAAPLRSPPLSDECSALAALDEVYRVEAPRLARYFQRRIGKDDEVGDLVHEAFVRLAGVIARRPLASPAPYLQRIARNLLFDRRRRPEARMALMRLSIDDAHAPAVAPVQAHEIEADDVMRIYRHALGELPEKTRRAFLLHRVDELTYREIGDRLGISIPTVQYHIGRALAHIDAALREE